MRSSAIDEAYPDHVSMTSVEGPSMSAWAGLLAAPPREAGAALADLLGLSASVGTELASLVDGVVLLVPRDPERTSSLRFRSLCVSLGGGGHLLFRGNEHSLPFDWPPDFRGPLARLGLVSFTGVDEIFVDSGPEASSIVRSLTEAGVAPPARLHPFYTDGQDQTSLWVGDDTSRTWVFDRAAHRLGPESENGFPGWFALHLATTGAR